MDSAVGIWMKTDLSPTAIFEDENSGGGCSQAPAARP